MITQLNQELDEDQFKIMNRINRFLESNEEKNECSNKFSDKLKF